MTKKLRELRNKLAQNPELGVGILEDLDEIIALAEVCEIKEYENQANKLILNQFLTI